MRAVIICGSPDCEPDFITKVVQKDDFVICADKGFEHALRANVGVDLLVGDFDSYKGELPEGITTERLEVRKDDSDSAHCACIAAERGFDEVVLLCALGGRGDHAFSNYCVLKYLSENGVSASIQTEAESVFYLKRGEHNFKNQSGKTFSVFPFGCETAVVTYSGKVDYPANGLRLNSTVSQGLSNIFKSDNVSIIVEEGGCLLFVETIL